jgi:hypothetical protein
MLCFVIAGENSADIPGRDFRLEGMNYFAMSFLTQNGIVTLLMFSRNNFDFVNIICRARSTSDLKSRLELSSCRASGIQFGTCFCICSISLLLSICCIVSFVVTVGSFFLDVLLLFIVIVRWSRLVKGFLFESFAIVSIRTHPIEKILAFLFWDIFEKFGYLVKLFHLFNRIFIFRILLVLFLSFFLQNSFTMFFAFVRSHLSFFIFI